MTTGIMDEIEVQQIPTPNQIPSRLDLTQLPAQVLRSAAVEALANQNEDLMARLNVAMKRSAQLENHISELQQERFELEHQLNSARDAALVLQEKDRRFSEVYGKFEAETQSSREQLQLLETQFSELFVTSQEQKRNSQEKIEKLSKEIQRYQRYHRRIQKATAKLKVRIETQSARLQQEEGQVRELRQHLAEAATRIQHLAKLNDQNQKQLVESYEKDLKDLRDQVSKLERENRAFSEKTQDYEALFEKSVALENRLIQEQRQFAEFRQCREKEIATLQVEVSDLRTQNKSNLIEIENLQCQFAEVSAESLTLKEKEARTTDQIETLQMLWQDSQTQIEKINVKNSALQNLNQQLSSTIQQQRHEINQLKGQIEAQNLNTTERIKEIKGQLQIMNKNSSLSFIEEQTPERVISRIDTLIAEIQSGYQRQTPSPVEGVSFELKSSSIDNRGSGSTSAP